MSIPSLTTFSYVVLALVGRRGATAHELVQMQRRGEAYFSYAGSQWYAEPKRLASLGLLRAEREAGRTRERTRYHLTDAGREALARWVPKPPRPPHVDSEGVVKVLAADLASDEAVLTSIRALRPELERMRASIREGVRRLAGVIEAEMELRATFGASAPARGLSQQGYDGPSTDLS